MLHRIAVLADSKATQSSQLQALEDAARARGVEVSMHRVASGEEITATIDKAKASGAGALNVLSSGLLYGNRQIIMDRVAALRFPAIYPWAEEAEEGDFLTYGPPPPANLSRRDGSPAGQALARRQARRPAG